MHGVNELWTKLDDLVIGDPAAELGFAARLARENGWSRSFADRVIGEYKRFIYLAMEAGHPVTPSDEVDQVWHLHLLYTESYWHDLCRDMLGRPLHHGPTRGGGAEGEKFRDWYAATQASYRRIFGDEPPADIWPPSERRFGIAPYFRRVNTAEHWVVSKRVVAHRVKVGAGVVAALSLTGCAATLAQQGPRGPLLFIIVVCVLLVGVLLLAVRKGAGEKKQGDDSGCGGGLFGGSGCGFGSDSDGGSGCGSGCGGCGGCGG